MKDWTKEERAYVFGPMESAKDAPPRLTVEEWERLDVLVSTWSNVTAPGHIRQKALEEIQVIGPVVWRHLLNSAAHGCMEE
jgi:hypothetical protein